MPSQSITDEIVELVERYGTGFADWCGEYSDDEDKRKADDAIAAIKSRLQEIEKELTELRGIVGPYGQSCLERTPALPCSNTIEELGDESGG